MAFAHNKTVKILAIGNSFSRDAIEQNLYDLAKADGQHCIVGNLYIGGCSLAKHLANMQADRQAYEYHKIGHNGKMTEVDSMSISRALADEDWDYVSIQQVSGLSGIYSSYTQSLPSILAYLHKHIKKGTRIVFHQTWAYAPNSSHEDFARYNNDQMKMYLAIVDATYRAAEQFGFDVMVPSGTALQNARETRLGDDLTRDGFHLDLVVGRYIAACAWYEALFGRNVMGNSYKPEAMSLDEQALSQWAAHNAVLRPYRITYYEDGAELDK